MNTATSYAQRNARVSRPERTQVEYFFKSIDQLVPRDHRCRLVWRFVQSLDLEPFYREIVVSGSQAGRSAIAPEVLIALWLMATLDGIGSARKLGRCCDTDLIFLWICGGVSVNHHTLSDFRVLHGEQLRKHGKDPHKRQKGDSDQYEAFRHRMSLPENQERYKKRPSIAEFPNADCRNRGLTQFRVRG